jgi:hypothetical protein
MSDDGKAGAFYGADGKLCGWTHRCGCGKWQAYGHGHGGPYSGKRAYGRTRELAIVSLLKLAAKGRRW